MREGTQKSPQVQRPNTVIIRASCWESCVGWQGFCPHPDLLGRRMGTPPFPQRHLLEPAVSSSLLVGDLQTTEQQGGSRGLILEGTLITSAHLPSVTF